MKKDKIKVGILDYSQLFSEVLSYVFADHKAFRVVISGSDVDKVLDHLDEIDVCIIDDELLMENKEEISHTAFGEEVKIIAFTNKKEKKHIIPAILHGVDGFLLEEMEAAEWTKAVQKVMDGNMYYHPVIQTTLIQQYRILVNQIEAEKKQVEQKEHNLTKRESEVLYYMAKGESREEIAKKMGITDNTVQVHLNNIYHKLDVNTKTEVVLMAIRNNWVNVE